MENYLIISNYIRILKIFHRLYLSFRRGGVQKTVKALQTDVKEEIIVKY